MEDPDPDQCCRNPALFVKSNCTALSLLISNVTLIIAKSVVLYASKVFNPGNIGDGSREVTTVTVTGAKLGDHSVASFSLDTQGIDVKPRVSSLDTVTVVFQNETGGAIDLANGTIKVEVREQINPL